MSSSCLENTQTSESPGNRKPHLLSLPCHDPPPRRSSSLCMWNSFSTCDYPRSKRDVCASVSLDRSCPLNLRPFLSLSDFSSLPSRVFLCLPCPRVGRRERRRHARSRDSKSHRSRSAETRRDSRPDKTFSPQEYTTRRSASICNEPAEEEDEGEKRADTEEKKKGRKQEGCCR